MTTPQADGLAFDRNSVRNYDADGRLHVETANISKANVCPYMGQEIPDWSALGLDPDRRYMLLRDPEELEKAAPSFNNLPILSKHVPVTAADHQPDLVIGSTGTNAEFAAPYLTNALVFWAAAAIKDIEDATSRDNAGKRELSSAYRYRADMTPGTYDGTQFDGVMRDIVGNHVALVAEGRAGTDVVVGDSKENLEMAKTVLTRKAAMASGAIIAYLMPKLAQDAQIDVTPAFKGVGPKDFKAKKGAIAEAVRGLVKGKLAQDADLDDLTTLLDSLESVDVAEGADADEPVLDPGAAAPEKKPEGLDAEPLARIKEYLKSAGVSDEVLGKLDELMGAPAAADEDKDDDKKDVVTPAAMDAAIKDAVAKAQAEAARNQREIRDAERTVRPYVGELAMAHDSAEGVYRTALKALNVDVADVHASALPAILKLQPLPSTRERKPALAQDAAAAKSFAERHPGAAGVRNV